MNRLMRDLVRIAGIAGDAIRELYDRGNVEISLKPDQSPVTAADRISHDLIVEKLKELTPGLPVLSEESEDVPFEIRTRWASYWLIDPLDGTKEFIHRSGDFAINIARIDDGKPGIGLIHSPLSGLTYFAEKGNGAFRMERDREPVPVRAAGYRGGQPKIVVSRFHSGAELERFLAKLPGHEARNMGSSLKICLVADGSVDLYPRFSPTMEWDTAAGHCIVEEAGGRLTDLARKSLKYNKPLLVNPPFVASGFPPFPWWEYLD